MSCRNTQGQFAKCAGRMGERASGRRDPAALRIGKTIYAILEYTPPDKDDKYPHHGWSVVGPKGGRAWIWRSIKKGADFVVAAPGGRERSVAASQVTLLPATTGPRPRPKPAKPKKPPPPKGQTRHTLKVGDILVNTWGYDQTNTDFFKVLALHGATGVTICPIGERVKRAEHGANYVVPAPGECIGASMEKRVGEGNSVKIHDWGSWARPWGGEARYQTASGWGH